MINTYGKFSTLDKNLQIDLTGKNGKWIKIDGNNFKVLNGLYNVDKIKIHLQMFGGGRRYSLESSYYSIEAFIKTKTGSRKLSTYSGLVGAFSPIFWVNEDIVINWKRNKNFYFMFNASENIIDIIRKLNLNLTEYSLVDEM